MRYLRKRGEEPLFLYPYTQALSKRNDMIECDNKGNLIGSVDSDGDAKDLRIEELEAELDKYRGSDLGAMVEALKAENDVLNEDNANLRSELEALKGAEPTDVPDEEAGPVNVKAYLKGVEEKVEAMSEDKDELEKYVKSEFGFDLDKRGSWAKLKEKTLGLAQAKHVA